MLLEAKRHQQRYETRFYSLENTKQGKVDVFTGKIEEAKFNWCL